MALAVVGEPDLAEDVCQDALFRAWSRLAECREPDRFGAWLAQAVRRHALNALRGRRSVPLDDTVPDARPAADRQVESAELGEVLVAALRRLSEEQRCAVLLFDMEGWSHAQIAATLETSEAMSRQHLMLGRRRLRELLAGERP